MWSLMFQHFCIFNDFVLQHYQELYSSGGIWVSGNVLAACRMDGREEGVSVLDVSRCQGQTKQDVTQECLVRMKSEVMV